MKSIRRHLAVVLSSALLGTMIAAAAGSTVLADTTSQGFESFTVGTPNGQAGWSSTGAFDHKIVDSTTYGFSGLGSQSLRISNAVTSGSFGDQTFSQSLTDAAGETTADGGVLSGGARQPHFEASWDVASTVPGAEQPGLSVVASPDRGDGARMSWIQMTDTPTGLAVNFNDYRDEHPVGGAVGDATGCGTNDDFFFSEIASDLNRTAVHTIKLSIDFLEGPRNDVVRVWVDGALVHVDTTWEDYFRYCEGNPTRTVDSILFRTGGTAAPATQGNGFLIDNLSMESGPIVTADSAGDWTLSPAQTTSSTTNTVVTNAYRAKVRAPINADGSSNFPKKRGVIPVQFDLESATRTVVSTTTTTGPVVFQSILSDNPAITDNDFSFLRFVPTAPLLFADLDELVADYSYVTGNCGSGSLRWSVRLDIGNNGITTDDKTLFIYFGDVPSFTDCTGTGSNSGENLIGSSDARFDLQQFGGPFYGTYADALVMIGATDVIRASLVLDSGSLADQTVNLTGASFDGNDWAPIPVGNSTTVISDTTTPFARTCDLPQAALKWSKNDPVPDGAVNEAESIQPKDTGQFYRTVDCKYIYNLDVSSLDPNVATRGGTYRVYVNIGGVNIADPAKFDLR